MEALINQARAQRGKHLAAEQADDIVEQARDIALLMGCG